MEKESKQPMHHIDSSVFLELFIKPTKRKSWAKECKEYLEYKIGKYYRGTISFLAFGQIMKTVASIQRETEWETIKAREDIFTSLVMILQNKNIQFWSPQFGCMKKTLEIKEEFHFEPADTLHLASASEDPNCNVFVTIDDEFLNNPILENKLGIRIKHPSTL